MSDERMERAEVSKWAVAVVATVVLVVMESIALYPFYYGRGDWGALARWMIPIAVVGVPLLTFVVRRLWAAIRDLD